MSVPEIFYQRALDAGFTPEAACSLIANIQGESGFRCDNAEDRINRVVSDEEYIRRADAGLITYNGKNFIYDEVGFGYIQWTFWSRKKGLYEFCKDRGTSVADHESQKEFVFVEMARDFPGVWNTCQTSHDIEKIMHDLVWIWENSDNKERDYNTRMLYARAWLVKFGGTASTKEDSIPNNGSQINDNTVIDPVYDQNGFEKFWPPRTIQKGLNWPETYLAQSLLRCHGYNVLVCGVFAESFEAKVKQFQADYALKADGIIGPKTWKKLFELPSTF